MTESKMPPDHQDRKPRYELSVYRKFIRDAAPYVSLIAGRRIRASEAETLSDAELRELALAIDARVDDLNKTPPPGQS
jgi:hypothetical protein